MEGWRELLRGDPLPWLLDPEVPAVRYLTLRSLLDEPEDAREVRRARAAAMRQPPIAPILEAQDPEGWWVRPVGYGPKYTGTVWSITVLDQMGADPADRRIARACEYVLAHLQAPTGGFGWSARPSGTVHCITGNYLRALLGFGFGDHPAVRDAVDWEVRSILGDGFGGYHPSATTGPGFGCAINGGLPCAWGAIKALRGLARVPPRRRTRATRAAIDVGAEFLLAHDLSTGAYPTDTSVSPLWFRLGFPSGYVADVLQGLEVLAELGHGRDARLAPAIDLVLSKQDAAGRWRNEHGYRGKLWADVDPPRAPSRWVTWRVCTMLRSARVRPPSIHSAHG